MTLTCSYASMAAASVRPSVRPFGERPPRGESRREEEAGKRWRVAEPAEALGSHSREWRGGRTAGEWRGRGEGRASAAAGCPIGRPTALSLARSLVAFALYAAGRRVRGCVSGCLGGGSGRRVGPGSRSIVCTSEKDGPAGLTRRRPPVLPLPGSQVADPEPLFLHGIERSH